MAIERQIQINQIQSGQWFCNQNYRNWRHEHLNKIPGSGTIYDCFMCWYLVSDPLWINSSDPIKLRESHVESGTKPNAMDNWQKSKRLHNNPKLCSIIFYMESANIMKSTRKPFRSTSFAYHQTAYNFPLFNANKKLIQSSWISGFAQ